MLWSRENIGNYWKLVEIEVMLLEIKIKDAIEREESVHYILKLNEKYKAIPMKNGKERNGNIEYIVKEYLKKQEKYSKKVH